MSHVKKFTLIDGSEYILDMNTSFYKELYLQEINKLSNKYEDSTIVLKYTGELFKNNIKIADNINNMSTIYNDNFLCDTFDNILMVYKDDKFYECSNTRVTMCIINKDAIKIIDNHYYFYIISCKTFLIHVNTNEMYMFGYWSFVEYDIDKIKPHSIQKISSTFLDFSSSYLFLNNNCITHCDSQWNIINTNYKISDIIDIYSNNNDDSSSDIFFVNKNSSIDHYKTVLTSSRFESLNFIENIKFNSQLIKYNGKNIFDTKNVYDVKNESIYFTNDLKKQIFILFCIIKKYRDMPTVMKLLIVCKMLT